MKLFRIRRKLERWIPIFVVVFGMMSLSLWVWLRWEWFRSLGKSDQYLVFGIGYLFMGFSMMMWNYLEGKKTITPDMRAGAELNDTFSRLAKEVTSLKAAQLDALGGNRQELIDALKPTVYEGIADELEERFRQRLLQFTRDQEIRDSFAAAEQRLRDELSALSRRGNLNLFIGVITTFIAVGLLTYMVLSAAVDFHDLTSLLSHYIPRLGLVLLIEVFSYFFLRLYKSTLAEMRVYQTDLTALTIQRVAVVAGLSTGDPAEAAALSKELLTPKPARADQLNYEKPDVDPKALAELVQVLAKLLPAKVKPA